MHGLHRTPWTRLHRHRTSSSFAHVFADAEWKEIRRRLLGQARRCQRCGAKRDLEAVHRVRIEDGGKPLDRGNVVAVCANCALTLALPGEGQEA